jgi:creatinine amidohydrolase
MPVLVEGGVHAVSPSGVLGNPIGATAQEGNDLMRRISGEIVGQLFSFWPELDPQLGAKGRD